MDLTILSHNCIVSLFGFATTIWTGNKNKPAILMLTPYVHIYANISLIFVILKQFSTFTFPGMPSNPLEKQFALLGTAPTAGLLDVQKAYRSVFFL